MKNTLKALVASLCVAFPLAAHAADDALVQRGAYLAKVGDCVACHSAPRSRSLYAAAP